MLLHEVAAGAPAWGAPAARQLFVLVNHFKSKGFGGLAQSNARRKSQAARVKQIYEALAVSRHHHVAVVGDLNDTPASDPLEPLIGQTDLRDVFLHPSFDDGGFPGTFGGCTANNKIDYLLLAPALFAKVQTGGVIRQGMWPGVKPVKWSVLDTLTKPVEAASDHAAVWVDLDL